MVEEGDPKTAVLNTEPLLAGLDDEAPSACLIVMSGANVGEMYNIEGSVTIGRSRDADVHIIGEGISRLHAKVVVEKLETWVEDLNSTNGTFLNGQKVEGPEPIEPGDKIQVGKTTVLNFTYQDELESAFQRELFDSALRDGMTKLYNKKYFLERLDAEFSYCKRHGTPLSLIMFDIDHFKKLNDTYGHLAGDFVLTTLAKHVSESIRMEDTFARYGGEEFAIICRGSKASATEHIAERIRKLVETMPFDYKEAKIRTTISMGVSDVLDREIRDAEGLIAATDGALYEAKNSGRNRVVIRKPSG